MLHNMNAVLDHLVAEAERIGPRLVETDDAETTGDPADLTDTETLDLFSAPEGCGMSLTEVRDATEEQAVQATALAWNDPRRIDYEGVLILGRRLAEQMPVDRVFTDAIDITTWSMQTLRTLFGGEVSSVGTQRALRAAALFWAAITEADAYSIPQAGLLLDTMRRAQKTYRREGTIHG